MDDAHAAVCDLPSPLIPAAMARIHFLEDEAAGFCGRSARSSIDIFLSVTPTGVGSARTVHCRFGRLAGFACLPLGSAS
jgi:hypothetical protein